MANQNPLPIPPGPGRPKGSTNKLSAAVRDMVEEALANAGGTEYLTQQAHKNPKAFLTLVAKLIPTELTGSLTIIHEEALAALERDPTALGEGAHTTH